MLKTKFLTLCLIANLLTSMICQADDIGQIVHVSGGVMKFYTGSVEVAEGERLQVKNSRGERDLTIEVMRVEPPYAYGTVTHIRAMPWGFLETMNEDRRVVLEVNKNDAFHGFFFVGGSYSEKVGDYGGNNYGLGIGMSGKLPVFDISQLRWSVALQADDLGKDHVGNGKRISYYMIGAGQSIGGFQYFAHLGIADHLTMPESGAPDVVDPYTGASYPSDVQHDTELGYLLTAKYVYFFKDISRNRQWGWGIGPYLSVGGTFASTSYKNTYTLGLSLDMLALL